MIQSNVLDCIIIWPTKTGIISYAIKIKHSAPRISRLAGQIGVLKKKTVKSVLRLNNYSWLSAFKIIVLIC